MVPRLLSLQTTLRGIGVTVIALLEPSRHACHAIERVQSISAHFSASKSVEVRALGSLIRAFWGWSKATARVAAVLRNAGVIMLVRRDILSKRGFLAGSGRLVPDGERHEHDSHQNGVLAALLVSRRRRHAKKHRCQIWQFRRAAVARCVRAKSKRVWFLRLDPRDMPWSHRELGAAAVLRIARGVLLTAVARGSNLF